MQIEIVFVTPNVPATGAGETAITVVPAAIGTQSSTHQVRLRGAIYPERVLAA
jgi:hypothetical protein